MADNFGGSENIFYTDDGNIVLIDPNSVFDSKGKRKGRDIKQENMVMYANLEATSVPRTRISVGDSLETGINNVSIASINFLKPNDKDYFDSSYTDQITGGRNSQGTVNQISYKTNQNPQQTNYVDTQLLGIKSISVDIKFNGVPEVNMSLVDVQGKALFETGGNSPYSVFLYYPYPLFKLTLKGYYGKAIQYELMLLNFNATFETGTGNYNIDLKFIARTSAILDDIRLGYLFALPNMYPSYQIPTTVVNNTSSQGTASAQQIGAGRTQELTVDTSSKGYDKIKQVFQEYKNRGLIDKNVPVLTLNEMSINLQKYTQFLNEQFEKLDFTRVVALNRYQDSVSKFSEKISTWRNKYIDNNDVLILKETSNDRVLYGLKNITFVTQDDSGQRNSQSNLKTKIDAEAELTGITTSSKIEIESVPIWGKNIPISNGTFELPFYKEKFTEQDINFEATYFRREGRTASSPTDPEFVSFKNQLILNLRNKGTLIEINSDNEVITTQNNLYYYTFDKINNELNNLNGIIAQRGEDENEKLNQTLLNRVKTNGNVTNLTFRPTVRNVIGTIMASVDAFYRLLTDVHKNAWNQRQNPYRIKSIIQNVPSQEGKNAVSERNLQNVTNIVYPWPQFVQKKEKSGNIEYQVTYPGSKSSASFTRAYDTRTWPEVEFVEQYLYGAVQKEQTFNSNVQNNSKITLKYTPSSAIEFNPEANVYTNTNVVDFLYEFYERLFLNAFYSGLYYTEADEDLIYVGSQIEYNNIINSGLQYGELRDILINQLPTTTLYDFIKSTGGDNQEGQKWNNFKQQNFITPYISNKVTDSFKIYSENEFNKLNLKPIKIDALDKIKSYLKSTNSSQTTIFDTFPFSNSEFRTKLEYSPNKEKLYQTIDTLGFDDGNLLINNYSTANVTYLSKLSSAVSGFTSTDEISHATINNFYKVRYNNPTKRMLSEGNVFYNENKFVNTSQTTSILNTPYFTNSIIDAANTAGDTKFIKSAYLLLNSLPLSTLYERLLNEKTNEKSDYIFASLTKFSAIHKIPYAWILKMGSVWYRYKNYVENQEDILDGIWQDFDYKGAYDPTTSATTTSYQISVNDTDSKTTFTLDDTNNIRVGFYPELYNSFYKLFTGYDMFTNNNVDEKSIEFYANNLKIYSQPSFNTLNGPIVPYYSYFKIDSEYVKYFTPEDVNKSLILPSAGYTPFQQSYFELTPNDVGTITKSELINSNQMYNGTSKFLWDCPNYGWFDNTKITKPQYNEYLRYVRPEENTQQTEFDLSTTYSKIEDLFAVFSKEQLDFFENEFLEFCKEEGESSIFLDSNQIDVTYGSFKQLLKKMFILDIGNSISAKEIGTIQNNTFSEIIDKFLSIEVYLKNGNPKQYDRYNFGVFQSNSTIKPENTTTSIYGTYLENSLPTPGITTLAQSKQNNPDAWKALETYVGFSTIKGISYGETSTIYDFFIDNNIAFTEQNVISLNKLIKIYATQKQKNSGYNGTTFQQNLSNLLGLALDKRNKIENQIIKGRLPSNLEKQTPTNTTSTPNKIEGDTFKLDTWELFKSINDKWVSGINFEEKLLFDEFLFLDRSNRDIGDELIVDVDTIRKYCIWENSNVSVMSLIREILAHNRMNFFVMPAYINFYGKPTSSTNNRNETILNNANDVFSLFTYVDYISSAPKFLCQYIDRPSQTLSMDNDPKYPFKSDSFDLGNSAGNPIRNTGSVPSSQQFKNNKAVGFVVDFGTENQSIFKSVDITQNQNVTSSEQIQTVIDMGNQGSGKQTAQQTTALFEFYKNRSYDCTVKVMGNVMIQPTMYFVLRHMPMFNGTYIIRNVKHTITSGKFDTEFKGQRMSSVINAKITDELAAINEDFTKKISDKVKSYVDNNTLITFNSNINQYITDPQQAKDYLISGRTPYQGNIVKSKNNETQGCYENINTSFIDLTNVEFLQQSITQSALIQLLKDTVEDEKLRLYLYTMIYLLGYKPDGKISYLQNNIYGITTDVNWGGLNDKIKTYRCLTTPENIVIPFANFGTLKESIEFARDYYQPKINLYFNTSNTTNQCVNNVDYNFKDPEFSDCTSDVFINLYYNTWYTAGNNAKKYTESEFYNSWLGIAKSAITKGLSSLTGLI
jgi:hypothetical protein